MEPDSPPPDVDPEIEALLQFEPVLRRCKRHDGWTEENQRRFIAALVACGDYERAAQSVGRTGSGAYKLRRAAGSGPFQSAWDKAIELYHRRNPGVMRIGRPTRGAIAAAAASTPSVAQPKPALDRYADRRTKEEIFESILTRYWLKVRQEREARLAGRIATADFYVRQLTYLEIALDLGGAAHQLLGELKRGGCTTLQIVATPMSVLLDELRRNVWAEAGEPERPPLSPLGAHDGEIATGVPTHFTGGGIDGDYNDWRGRQDEAAALAAEAQRAWEEKAKADAEAWAKRVEAGLTGICP